MIRTTSIALLALAGLALAQVPRQKPPLDKEAARRAFYGGHIDAAAHQQMQGIWRIQRMEWEGTVWQGQQLEGIALIDAGHLSIEINADVSFDPDDGSIVHQSGIFRYRFNELGELETTTLIGLSNIEDTAYFVTAEPGEVRTFRVRLTNEILILERLGTRITMRRLPQPNPPFHDRVERQKQRELEAAGGDRKDS